MPDKWVKTRQPVDWFSYSAKATGNYNKGAEMKPNENKLRSCPICGNTIKRRPSESWPSYAKKTACSFKCAALIRKAKERERNAKESERNANESEAENALRTLEIALRNWRVA
jgi:predicted nucleic acid-binding Zn ribbon protein